VADRRIKKAGGTPALRSGDNRLANKHQTTNNKQQTTNNKQQTTNNKQLATKNGRRAGTRQPFLFFNCEEVKA